MRVSMMMLGLLIPAAVQGQRAPAIDRSMSVGAQATLVQSQDMLPQDTGQVILRRVWSGPEASPWGGLSPDGRYVTFVEWPRGDLALRDMRTGEVRCLTNRSENDPEGAYPDVSIMSRDGRRVAYSWYPGDWVWEMHVVDIDGSNRKILLQGPEGNAEPFDFSPDGQEVLVSLPIPGERRKALALVSVADGSKRVLKEFDDRGLMDAIFSPDGEYVLYTTAVAGEPQRDIFTLSLADRRQHTLIENPADDYILGWVPGTDYVLFASDRTGTLGAWVIQVKDGSPVGSPTLVKPDLWQATPLGLTTDGAFYYGVRVSSQAVRLATVDPQTKRLLGEPIPIDPRQHGNSMRPRWSPDGRYLSYVKQNGSPWQHVVGIRSMETGETREIETGLLRAIGGCSARWSPDARSFIMCGRDRSGGRGLFQVDVQTGRTVAVKRFEGGASFWTDWAPDGKTIYYRVDYGEESRIEALDLETGAERILRSSYSPFWIVMIYVDVSPDGREMAFWESEQGTGNWHLRVIPTSPGGRDVPARELLTLGRESRPIQGVNWSPDGRHLLYMAREGDAARLWRVPAAGGEPERLDLVLEGPPNRPPLFSPDGRRIAFEAGESSWEIWVMQNFLPKE